MASFHDVRELRGNQGREEEEGVILVEPIAMIVPPELQDVPETIALGSSTNSSADGGALSPPTANTELEVVVLEKWENKVIRGRLDNLRKAPKTLPASFRSRAALHHEVADSSATVKGYKKLEEMVRHYQIPKTILLRAGTQNKRACTVSRMGWVLVYVDHFDVGLRFPPPDLIFDILAELEIPVKAIAFRSLFLCCMCPSTTETMWYVISGREKMMIFTNIRNKVTRWKRQFIFVHDTRTEKMNNELVACISEWRMPNTYMNYPQLALGDVDWKNRLLDYVKAEALVDLETLVTPEQLALLGSVDVANLYAEAQSLRNHGVGFDSQRQTHFDEQLPATTGRSLSHRSSSSASRPGAEQRVETTPLSSRTHARDDSDAEDDIPLIRRRTISGAQPASAAATWSTNVPPALAREVAKPVPTLSSVSGPRIAYPEGFSYVRTDCQATMV
ncbi:hypothetical protein SLEP1_g55690 [Rubroshorea leprosula]|uniref:Uncharacterized protein n=1 Tax=Rubroshorea leprosula TaxID=152421 RepID=A0AAV5MJ63_9ROSI|nr:hypothetical protein SLEP1_g55690 [Rubroshorea leprosula]